MVSSTQAKRAEIRACGKRSLEKSMVMVTIPVATVISCLVESPRKSKACLRQSGGIGGTGGTGGPGGAAGAGGGGGPTPGVAGGTGVDGDDISPSYSAFTQNGMEWGNRRQKSDIPATKSP